MHFNINNYKGQYAMHCKTEEEAKSFCDYLHEQGRKWCCGNKSYQEETLWDVYCKDTIYYFNEGAYGDIDYAKHCTYTILEWEEFMKHTFTKADLKNWDIIQYRNGNTAIVNIDLKSLISKEGYNSLNCIIEDLTCGQDHNFDIIAVRRPKIGANCQLDAFKYGRGTLVYEREEVEEMTLAEVCKLLGKNIKIVK